MTPGLERSPGGGHGNLQESPVFLPGESYGQRSLAGSSPWDRQESDRAERLILFILGFIGYFPF